MASGNVAETRGLLDAVLTDRIVFRPTTDDGGAPMYELTMPVALDRLLTSLVPGLQVRVASPTGFEPVFWP